MAFIFGACFLLYIFPIYNYSTIKSLVSHGKIAQGKVVGYYESCDSGRRNLFGLLDFFYLFYPRCHTIPKIEYRRANGDVQTFGGTSIKYNDYKLPEVSSLIEVIYTDRKSEIAVLLPLRKKAFLMEYIPISLLFIGMFIFGFYILSLDQKKYEEVSK